MVGQIRSAHQTMYKNMRSQAIEESTKFVKTESEHISKMFTQDMQVTVKQFIDYQKRVKSDLDKYDSVC